MSRRTLAGRMIRIGLLLTLCVFLWALALWVAGAARQTLPNGVTFRRAQGLELDILHLETPGALPDSLQLAACRVSQGTISTEGNSREAELVYTAGNWAQVAPPGPEHGSWYVHSDIPEENHYAVISHELALALFFTDDAVGRSLEAGGLQLLVTGVLPPQNALARLCGSGLPQIYLPMLQPGAAEGSLHPHYLFAADNALSLSVRQAADWLGQMLQHPLVYDSASHYGQALAAADTVIGAGIFLCALAVALILLTAACHRAVWLWRAAKPLGSLREALYRRRVAAAFVPLALAAATGLFWVARFPAYLPPEMLPADNIFDVGHYFETIVQQLQLNNRFAAHDAWWTLSQRALAWQTAACIAATTAFGLLCRCVAHFCKEIGAHHLQ